MLTYEINRNNFGSPYENVKILSYNRQPYSIFNDNDFRDVITYTCNEEVPFVEGQEITISHSYYLPDINSETGFTRYKSESTHTVYNTDKTTNTFSIIVDRYVRLSLYNFFEYNDENNVKWWYFLFNDGLAYSELDYNAGMTTLFVEGNSSDTNNRIEIDCEYVDNTTLRWKVDNTIVTENDIANIMNSVYTWRYEETEPVEENVTQVDFVPVVVTYNSYEYIKTNYNNINTFYKKTEVDTNISSLTVSKDAIQFSNDDTITILKPRILAGIKVPLSSKYDTGIYNEEVVRYNLVENETKNSINKFIDMEKNLYTPVIETSDGFVEVLKIRFNMHFRKHRGQNWLVEDDDSLWNGCDDNGGLYGYVGNDQPNQYFSYNTQSNQSDLLMFLGFTNADVRFRKSRLSKSFLRLSFYDSINPADQNLLAYSTIYLDAGSLYSKMARNSTGGSFTIINYNDDPDANTNNIPRLMVNCEPARQTSSQTEDDVESKRLSSQIVVRDRNNSRLSSEGFYLYLWKDIDERNMPQTIYMKTEFHHAGYGRKIPFMAPYNKESNNFKSFQDILDDWSGDNTGYNFQQYNDYSYIRLKYVYDQDNDRYVYYLDKDIYKESGQNTDDNSITINLYEAKVRF